MKLTIFKYHALRNDFLIIDGRPSLSKGRNWPAVVRRLCDRRSGVGADGVLLLSRRQGVDRVVDLFNADGGWAEKSGNGLRCLALHLFRDNRRCREFRLRMNDEHHLACVEAYDKEVAQITTGLGCPDFQTAHIPVVTRQKYLINSPLRIGKVDIPVTCLSVGNPHTVLLVDSFEFDWKAMGAELECHSAFPQGTNVEFIKPITSQTLQVADWERGAGATGSSGTGAAAAVCAGVMLGIVRRRCRVKFDSGYLRVTWDAATNQIELTGPAQFVTTAEVDL